MQRHVFYSGTVQGVGFRQTCQRLARGFPVSGWVRNLDDGRVELWVEGDAGELQGFLDSVAGRLGEFIQQQRESEPGAAPPPGPSLEGFRIRYD